MNFKKDYINFVLHSVTGCGPISSASVAHSLRQGAGGKEPGECVRKVLEKIISSGDLVKTTFLVGKTAGLELLFKYLLYMSDKIDKSQITIFNIKDNFEYDIKNLTRICANIEEHRNQAGLRSVPVIEAVSEDVRGSEILAQEIQEGISDAIKIEAEEKVQEEISEIVEDGDSSVVELEALEEEPASESAFTLVGNKEEKTSSDSEVFELPDINQPPDIEDSGIIDREAFEKQTAGGILESEEEADQSHVKEAESELMADTLPVEVEEETERKEAQQPYKEITEPFEFEVRTGEELAGIELEKSADESGERTLEELKNKFFEEIKILEKHLFHIEKDFKEIRSGKLKPSVSRRLSEAMQLSGELSQLTKRLNMEDISRIFFSISLYSSKVAETPGIIARNSLKLLLSSLDMANVQLKGETYSNYRVTMQKVDDLINNLTRKPELKQEIESKQETTSAEKKQAVSSSTESAEVQPGMPLEKEAELKDNIPVEPEPIEDEIKESEYAGYPKQMIEVPEETTQAVESFTAPDSANFKMRYLVKQFEKEYLSLNEIQGEYVKFDALEKIDALNNSLRIIARIAAAVKFEDVLKLAEVSYVFLKYLKDYRMNVLDPEIQQIIKYIVFTFKMLLTERKPEDFEILVQYLNNPVKIFTDS